MATSTRTSAHTGNPVQLTDLDPRHRIRCVAVRAYDEKRCTATASAVTQHGDPVCGHHTGPATEIGYWRRYDRPA